MSGKIEQEAAEVVSRMDALETLIEPNGTSPDEECGLCGENIEMVCGDKRVDMLTLEYDGDFRIDFIEEQNFHAHCIMGIINTMKTHAVARSELLAGNVDKDEILAKQFPADIASMRYSHMDEYNLEEIGQWEAGQ